MKINGSHVRCILNSELICGAHMRSVHVTIWILNLFHTSNVMQDFGRTVPRHRREHDEAQTPLLLRQEQALDPDAGPGSEKENIGSLGQVP